MSSMSLIMFKSAFALLEIIDALSLSFVSRFEFARISENPIIAFKGVLIS